MLGLTLLGVAPSPAAAVIPEWRFEIWMLPPVADTGTNACLRRGFHSTDPNYEYMRSIDWARNCGTASSEPVRFRGLGVNVDSMNGAGIPNGSMSITTHQLSSSNCPGGGTVTIGKVTIWSIYGTSLAGMIYAHTDMDTSLPEHTIFAKGTTVANGMFNSVVVGDSVSDWDAPNCFTGFHVHETNINHDGFDYWNTGDFLNEPLSARCDCYLTTSSANWTRRMNWTLQGAE